MANQEHLDILKQGIVAWNQWREEQTDIIPDLSEADLSEAILYEAIQTQPYPIRADFSGANLRGADLTDVDLMGVDLSHGNLNRANLQGARLYEANAKGANLSNTLLDRADLRGANLSGANLSGAKLTDVILRGARLYETNFSRATIGWTSFGSVNLSMVKGLETVKHVGPSTIGIDTVYRSQGNIPEAFLKGAGVDDTFITYIHSLIGKAIEYYSCFISYSSKDDAFAKRLYADLQSNNVRCWFAPEDLKWGERIRSGIDEAIRMHEKLLLILSKHSVSSGWVEREVKIALTKEHTEKRTVLFPVRVDRAVFESPFDWATEIRHERNIGDFTHWKYHDDYQMALIRLLRDLKISS